jgi:HD-like signal output (HDOD) protein
MQRRMALDLEADDDDMDMAVDVFDVEGELAAAVARGSVEVPPLPALALKLQAALTSEASSLSEIVELIGLDQRLATDVLRAANASIFGGKQPATSTDAAVRRLGTTSLACIAFQATLGGVARAQGPLAALRREIWLESVVSAAVARAVAAARGISPDSAFLCGIVHDFGKVVALGFLEEALGSQHGEHDAAFLLSLAERHHVALGNALAFKWALPDAVRAVIAHHHNGDESNALVQVIRAADAVTALLLHTQSVGADDILACGAVRDAYEADAVARALVQVPPLVAAFCDGDALKRVQGARVPVIPPIPRGNDDDNDDHGGVDNIPAVITGGAGGPREVSCVGCTRSRVVLRSHTAMPQSWAAHLVLDAVDGERPIELWILIKLCVPDGNNAFVLEAAPFALSGDAKKRWYDFAKGD